MGELFTVQRFFNPSQLEEDGDSRFDAWSAHYGEVVDGLEQKMPQEVMRLSVALLSL